MKKMLAAGMIMMSMAPSIMATPLILGENNVIVQKNNKVITYAVKSATMTEPVEWLGGMKTSTLELTLTAEGNVCPAKESDVTFLLSNSDLMALVSPTATLELLSYYKHPVNHACPAYSQETDVTVKIGVTVADYDEYDWLINIPLGYKGQDGVTKVTVSVKPHFKFSVQLN